ncbi:Major facilitator superfamily [Cynara cardunculus var. scolymus]|uniref:Major facilitator superfamily n=2 Tax=Cynara cardunculus var. scolymus TaxID=59895 RepID=A0A124SEH9_CYNCS|nr:Major facilitator superfamily [Cynara cardunculus var. scolymus]
MSKSTTAILRRDGGGQESQTYRLAIQVIQGRWFSLFASFLIMAGAGATYLFGIYSKDIKTTLAYDQTTLNLIGFFKDLGANIGVISGLIAEVTPTWCLLLIGAAVNFTGYFMMWLAVTHRIPEPRVWQMCMYMCIAANAQNFENTGVLVTTVRNFPENRGVVLGLLKGFTGLSGAIMAQIYLAVYGDDSKALILLIAWLPAAVSVVFVYTIREINGVKQSNENEIRVFYHFLIVSIVLALFIMAMTIAQKLVAFSPVAYAGSSSVICFLLFAPLFISIKQELEFLKKTNQESSRVSEVEIENLDHDDHEPSLNSNFKSERKLSFFENVFLKKPERGDDFSILQALLSTDMAILYVATFCGLGTSFTAVDNLGQIGESLGYPRKSISTIVSLLSIWNYFGRIFAGFVSEHLLIKFKFPRPLMMTLVLLLSCIGHLLIAFPFTGSVYIASIIIGFSFGAQLPLLFAIVSELFGLKHFSTLFNCAQLGSPVGSYVLNVRVTGPMYDREALKVLESSGLGRSAVKELVCIGKQCYRQSFMVLAGVCCFGALATLVLVARTREFYNGDIYSKFKEPKGVAKTQHL